MVIVVKSNRVIQVKYNQCSLFIIKLNYKIIVNRASIRS